MSILNIQNFVSDHFHLFSLPDSVLQLNSLTEDPRAAAVILQH